MVSQVGLNREQERRISQTRLDRE